MSDKFLFKDDSAISSNPYDDNYEIQGQASTFMGAVGMWVLHIVVGFILVYSAYHGIHASLKYTGSSELAKAAQIAGIIVTEIVMLGIYLAWHNQKITSAPQSITAGLVYLIGFAISGLNIVADSQITAMIDVPKWLVTYLSWGLPIAPIFMGFGAVLIHELAPEQLFARKKTGKLLQKQENEFLSYIVQEENKLKNKTVILRSLLQAERTTAKGFQTYLESNGMQELMQKRGQEAAVHMLAQALGIDVSQLNDVNDEKSDMSLPLVMASDNQLGKNKLDDEENKNPTQRAE